MSDETKDTAASKAVKATKKAGEDTASITRPDDADPTPGKAHVTQQGNTSISTRW